MFNLDSWQVMTWHNAINRNAFVVMVCCYFISSLQLYLTPEIYRIYMFCNCMVQMILFNIIIFFCLSMHCCNPLLTLSTIYLKTPSLNRYCVKPRLTALCIQATWTLNLQPSNLFPFMLSYAPSLNHHICTQALPVYQWFSLKQTVYQAE